MKISHRFFSCSELFNPKCGSFLSEYFFLKLLSFSERSVVWTPKTCVMVELWLNRLNSAAWLWNSIIGCTHGCEARIWSLLIKKIYTKETLCIWNLNRPLSFGSDSFQKKVLKEVKTSIHQQQSPCAPLFPLPRLLLLPPWLAWTCSPAVFGKAGVCLESALLPEG